MSFSVSRLNKAGQSILYRYLQPEDDIAAITALLHEAYAPLAQQGMRFVASYQNALTTRSRMDKGDTIVAIDGKVIIGTITLKRTSETAGSPFYDRPDVAGFGQFAVRPSHQRKGIGSILMDMVERLAAERDVRYIALDTSDHASDLIKFYMARGYRFVEHVQWAETNYRSSILAKTLRPLESEPRPD